MDTMFVTASDGHKLAYDLCGSGPALMLLHGGGGGQSRQSWHEFGYVAKLKEHFTVITMDARGHGESDKPTDPSEYAIEQMCIDILTVADVCDIDQFQIWGFSYGGNIGRFLATQSDRIKRLIVIGIPFGLAADGEFRQFIYDFTQKWQPLLADKDVGSLEGSLLSDADQKQLHSPTLPVAIAWLNAMLDWGSVSPKEVKCPLLWASGSENAGTMESILHYQNEIDQTSVQTIVFEGLTHIQEFEKVDTVFSTLFNFSIESGE